MDEQHLERDNITRDGVRTLLSQGLEPIPCELESGIRAVVYPAGTHMSLKEYMKFLAPKHSEQHTLDPLEIWHTAVDTDGIIWLGANTRLHGDVWNAIESDGRKGVDDNTVRLHIYIDRQDMVYQIGIPFSFTHLTEEAAYRVLEIIPKARILEDVKITGSGCSKVLGMDEKKELEHGDPKQFMENPNYISSRKDKSGLWVTYKIPNYPDELIAAQREKFGIEKNLWLWQQAVQEKYKIYQR